VIDEHYLASVAGEVSWSMKLGTFEVTPREGYTSIRGLKTWTAAVLNVPMVGAPRVLVLNSMLLQPFRWTKHLAVSENVYAVEFQYASAGQLLSGADYRDWLAKDEPRRRGTGGRTWP
jgi:hypothetical protein